MSEPRRYESATRQMYEAGDGKFVLHDDYAALLARVARLEEALSKIAYADRWTFEKDGSDIAEHFQKLATGALGEK